MSKNLEEFFKKFSVKLDEDVSTDTPETPETSEEMDLDPRDPDDSNVTNTEVPNDENPNVTVTGGYKRLTKEEMDRLYAIKDPKTGEQYAIPFLLDTDPDYYFKYVDYMRTLERQPEQFKRIMEWN